MSLSLGSALFAFALSIICSMVVAKRSSNRRIRLLALTVGLLPLCQAVVLLGRHHWFSWVAIMFGSAPNLQRWLNHWSCSSARLVSRGTYKLQPPRSNHLRTQRKSLTLGRAWRAAMLDNVLLIGGTRFTDPRLRLFLGVREYLVVSKRGRSRDV